MTQEIPTPRKHSNSYNIFILVLTVLSLIVMVVLLLPLSDETIKLLSVYDNLICVIFLIDFFFNLKNSPKKSDYFIKERGWLDLLGSIPSLGLLTNVGKFAGLLRLARLSRLARASLACCAVKTERRWLKISSKTAAGTQHSLLSY